MKTTTVLLVLAYLFVVACIRTIHEDKNNVTVSETLCQWCSDVYKTCTNRCPVANACNADCKKQACNSYIKGHRCSEMCLWYC
ncbi:hypothetical protein J1614_009399 [Plenodomus biglobosus]|nr:hypothetical protein J1614_009399 [Plenodomus biglobosus]